MRMSKWFTRLLPRQRSSVSYIRNVVTGSLYRLTEAYGNSTFNDIKTLIDTMRALAHDSQISTALSYYATDATVTNSKGQIIWATPVDKKYADTADMINALFDRWHINEYARDHILELATIGNLYIPTTGLFKEDTSGGNQTKVAIDNNTIQDNDFDIIPSYKLPPEDVLDIWQQGVQQGYIYQPDSSDRSQYLIYPPDAIIHFSLGGMLGDYSISAVDSDGVTQEYDIKFAKPLLEHAVQPTQTLSLLEDALLLSSLSRIIRFISVECGELDEEETRDALQQIKDKIEQQLSINTANGDAQSFVNPQSPNNIIYLPRINGQEPISITDLNMTESNESDNKLLDHYQDKKLSVLGVPKEAMNFSSNEGLGGAGTVLSQRSAIYANSLQRLETAYISGWKTAIDTYFKNRNFSGLIGKYELHMQPIVTTLSTVLAERRDAAVGQATQLVDLLKNLGVTNSKSYLSAISEVLSEVMPQTSADAKTWDVDVAQPEGEGADEF